jgi:hypothetical protein
VADADSEVKATTWAHRGDQARRAGRGRPRQTAGTYGDLEVGWHYQGRPAPLRAVNLDPARTLPGSRAVPSPNAKDRPPPVDAGGANGSAQAWRRLTRFLPTSARSPCPLLALASSPRQCIAQSSIRPRRRSNRSPRRYACSVLFPTRPQAGSCCARQVQRCR